MFFRRIRDSQFINHISFLWHWKNFFFLLKYPFYRSRNRWTGKFTGYAYTELDSVPYGWRKAFGKQMTKDILKAGKATRKRLGKHCSWKKMLRWEQIKEKWGSLCLYASCSQEIREVLDKYETLSECYCICCGKPARYRTTGWVEYYCEDCMKEEVNRKYNDTYLYKDEFRNGGYEECRLTKEDIPELCEYEYKVLGSETFTNELAFEDRWNYLWDNLDKTSNIHYRKVQNANGTLSIEHVEQIKHIINTKEKYGFTYEELWGLE